MEPSDLVIRLKVLGVRACCFDFDQTLVSAHSARFSSGTRLLRADVRKFAVNVTSAFKTVVPLLVSAGIHVAVTTHTDAAEFGGTTQPETHILGEELVRSVLCLSLGEELAAQFFVVAYNPRARGEEGARRENRGKRRHLRLVCERFNLTGLHELRLFDDMAANVSDILNGVQVDSNFGFRVEDLARAAFEDLSSLDQDALHAMVEYTESTESFPSLLRVLSFASARGFNEVAEASCDALLRLTTGLDAVNKLGSSSLQACAAVCACLRAFIEQPSTVEVCLSCVNNLASSPLRRDELRECGIAELLVSAMSTHTNGEATLQEQGCLCCAALATESITSVSCLRNAGAEMVLAAAKTLITNDRNKSLPTRALKLLQSKARGDAKGAMSVLSYNIWFESLEFDARLSELIRLIGLSNADFVALQEVTARSLPALRRAFSEEYSFSPFDVGSYGCLLLAKKSLGSAKFKEVALPTRMGRSLLTVEVASMPGLVVATAHLESLSNQPTRRKQLEVVERATRTNDRVVFVGDFNFDSNRNFQDGTRKGGVTPSGTRLDNADLQEVLSEFVDAWPALWGDEERGYTFDSNVNGMLRKYEQMRYDRVMLRGVAPKSIRLVGTEAMAGSTIWPSDHFGLHCSFD